jgi:hypothetical protein
LVPVISTDRIDRGIVGTAGIAAFRPGATTRAGQGDLQARAGIPGRTERHEAELQRQADPAAVDAEAILDLSARRRPSLPFTHAA